MRMNLLGSFFSTVIFAVSDTGALVSTADVVFAAT
jgi:hypothetical protein